MDTSSGFKALNANSYISLGIVVLLVSSGVWLNNRFNDLGLGQKDISFDVRELKTRVIALETKKDVNAWSIYDMFKWTVHFQQQNPTLKVPEVKHEE